MKNEKDIEWKYKFEEGVTLGFDIVKVIIYRHGKEFIKSSHMSMFGATQFVKCVIQRIKKGEFK